MSACYMPLYQGDYHRDTGHLTTLEHGAYLLLLMHYYAAGGLPEGDDRLSGIVRLPLEDWLKIKPTIHAFFHKNWRHKRADDELMKHKRLSDNGKLGGRPQKADGKPNESPKPSHTKERETEILEQVGRPNGRPSLPVEKAFEEFWEKYPRKVGKGAARKSFARIAKSKKVGFSEIMAALKCTKWPDDPQFIPHPATWLNQGRWEDEPTGDARPMPTPAEAAAAAEYLRAHGIGGIRTAFKDVT